jgi:hypothetical protein
VPADVVPAAVGEAAAPGGAGVVDQQVQPAVLALHRLGHAPRRVVLEQVDGEDGRVAEFAGERAQALLTAGDEHYARAGLARQAACGGLADTARGAGDERDHPRIMSKQRYSRRSTGIPVP